MDETLVAQEEWSATYIDDIVIFSKSWEEHLVHVRKVLEALEKVGMTANLDKCTWGARTLTYLGHEVGGGVVKVHEARIAAIKNFKRPVTKRDVRAFLGPDGHYRVFIPEFAGRMVPLYQALKKAAPSKLCWGGGGGGGRRYVTCFPIFSICFMFESGPVAPTRGRHLHLADRCLAARSRRCGISGEGRHREASRLFFKEVTPSGKELCHN